MTYENRTRRKQDVIRRVSKTDAPYSYCHVIGCPFPPTARTGKGLNRLYCRKHEDHFERHGSYFKRSYTASEINPYRKAALRWIKENQEDYLVSTAILKVETLYRNAGQHVEAFRLTGKPPEERARAAWARLRVKGVDARIPLSIWVAVEMISLSDPEPGKPEFKHVQAAKIIHRQASGSHKKWEQVRSDGRIRVVELHKFPMSRGLVLRHIGKQLERGAELVVDKHLDDIRSSMITREESLRVVKRTPL
jgi:hypothetical protein